MLRAILTLVTMLVLLVGAGLWFADEQMPPEIAEALEPVVERTIEIARSAPQWVPEKIEAVREEIESAVQVAASRVPSTQPDEEVVVEVVSDPSWNQPFREDDHSVLPQIESAENADEASVQVAAAPDQDEWAHLIRRMLRIYERVDGGP